MVQYEEETRRQQQFSSLQSKKTTVIWSANAFTHFISRNAASCLFRKATAIFVAFLKQQNIKIKQCRKAKIALEMNVSLRKFTCMEDNW